MLNDDITTNLTPEQMQWCRENMVYDVWLFEHGIITAAELEERYKMVCQNRTQTAEVK